MAAEPTRDRDPRVARVQADDEVMVRAERVEAGAQFRDRTGSAGQPARDDRSNLGLILGCRLARHAIGIALCSRTMMRHLQIWIVWTDRKAVIQRAVESIDRPHWPATACERRWIAWRDPSHDLSRDAKLDAEI